MATKTDPPKGTVATTDNLQALVAQGKWSKFLDAYSGDFGRVMPAHVNVEAFIGLAAAYVRGDPNLQAAVEVNPGSLILALRHCAALGHMPIRGIYALVPFNNRKATGGKQVVGMEEYRGVVERMYRAGGIQSVHVEIGREKDARLRFQRTRMVLPDHDYDEFASDEDRGALKAVYAWARMSNGGTSQVAWLPRSEVQKHRDVSKSGDSFWGPPWPAEGPWTADMWRKTALHVLERFVPTSAELRYQVAMAEAAAPPSRDAPRTVGAPEEYIQEAEIVEESAATTGPAEHSGAPALVEPPRRRTRSAPTEHSQEPPSTSEGGQPWPDVPPIPGKDTSS